MADSAITLTAGEVPTYDAVRVPQNQLIWKYFSGAPAGTRTPGLLVRSYAVTLPPSFTAYCFVRDAASLRAELSAVSACFRAFGCQNLRCANPRVIP
jgi:hypothetical protein